MAEGNLPSSLNFYINSGINIFWKKSFFPVKILILIYFLEIGRTFLPMGKYINGMLLLAQTGHKTTH